MRNKGFVISEIFGYILGCAVIYILNTAINIRYHIEFIAYSYLTYRTSTLTLSGDSAFFTVIAIISFGVAELRKVHLLPNVPDLFLVNA